MAAQGSYSVTFKIVDDATAMLDKINKQIAGLQAPILKLKSLN